MKRPSHARTSGSSSSGPCPERRARRSGGTRRRRLTNTPASAVRRWQGNVAVGTTSSARNGSGATTGISSLRELQREAMLFEDLRVAPAPGAVELGHHRGAVFQQHLEHAVLVRVQLQQATVAAPARRSAARRARAVGSVRRMDARSAWHASYRCAPPRVNDVWSTAGAAARPRRRHRRPVVRWVVRSAGPRAPRARGDCCRPVHRTRCCPASLRLSGAKKESWKKSESCHNVARSRRRFGVAVTAGDLATRVRRRRRGLRPARRCGALRHQQLQFGNRRHVIHRAAQVAHTAGASTACLICITRRELPRSVSRSIAASTRPLALQTANVTWIAPSSSYQKRTSCGSVGWQKRTSGSLDSTM